MDEDDNFEFTSDAELSDIERNLLILANDRCPRTRATAVQGMEVLCSRGKCLSRENYQNVIKLCEDSDIRVRLSALRIVVAYANAYKNYRVRKNSDFHLRLHDDAFIVVCHAINDIDVELRAEAARLLGEFTDVSGTFLHQTLDKKLMHQMKMVNEGGASTSKPKPGGGGAAAAAGNSGWSSGKKLGEDMPMEKDDDDNHSLIPIGACGAFVTALEDEFMAVRQAAVHSLGRLATNRKDFARLCIDHLADMFNDEIQEVRLDAIRALAPLVAHGTLHQDQLYTILTVLDDASAENRMAVHDLIARSNLADAECIRHCIRVLIHSLKRFPLDKYSIYQCLSAIGLRHSLFVHGLVSELLEIHPLFDTPEQHIDDDFYLGKLILVLNAASREPVICSLIPAYVKKHYRYLRCSLAHLIPIVKEIETSKSSILTSRSFDFVSKDTISLHINKVDELLESTYGRVVDANAKEPFERTVLFDMIMRDLRTFQHIEEEIAVPSTFVHDFCTVLRIHDTAMSAVDTDDDLQLIAVTFAECCEKVFRIENQFIGLDNEALACLHECLLRVFVIFVALQMDADSLRATGGDQQRLLVAQLTAMIGRTQRRIVNELRVRPMTSLAALCDWLKANVLAINRVDLLKSELLVKNETDDMDMDHTPFAASGGGSAAPPLPAKLTLGQRIVVELERTPLVVPKHIGDVRRVAMKTVKVVDPSQNVQNETVIRFIAGLPTGIVVSCFLYKLNKEDLQQFRIQVKYPDQTVTYFRPKPADFHRVEDERVVRVHTTVVVSAVLWAEPASLNLVCGLLIPSNKIPSLHSLLSAHGETNKQNSFLPFSLNAGFVPLPDANYRARTNQISIKIHPMQRT